MATGDTQPDAAFKRQYRNAVARGRRSQPRADAAYYDPVSGMIVVRMTSAAMFAFPPMIVEGLNDAVPSDLAEVTIQAAGTVLQWEALDVQFELTALLGGVFGTRAWMRELGRRGGRVTSEAKTRAARENGRKGGRPRKQ